MLSEKQKANSLGPGIGLGAIALVVLITGAVLWRYRHRLPCGKRWHRRSTNEDRVPAPTHTCGVCLERIDEPDEDVDRGPLSDPQWRNNGRAHHAPGQGCQRLRPNRP